MSEKIYKMKLHEEIELSAGCRVIRVPGGWIYRLFDGSTRDTLTFVPFNNEFMEANK